MAFLGDASVKTKLILTSILSKGVALLIAGVVITSFDLMALREKLVRRMSIQADIVGANCVSALLFSDPKSAETTLAALKADPRIRAAGLYAADRRLFATYLQDPSGETSLLEDSLGDPLVLLQSPMSATLLGIALVALLAPFVLKGLGRFRASED